jgi:hypothetical protein
MKRGFSMKSGRLFMIAHVLLVLVVVLALLPSVSQGKDAYLRNQQLREAAAHGDLGAVRKLAANGPEKTRGSLPRE